MTKFYKKIFSGHQRSVGIKKNILASFAIKGVSIVIGFMMVPLCLGYLDQTRYGIWLTVSSVIAWFNFFEIGLGTGLRNRLAESLAVKDFQKARIYVSTTYAILSIVSGLMIGLTLIFARYIDWTTVFNTDKHLLKDLTILVNIVFSMFFLQFVLKLIGIVLYADQKPAMANLIGPLSNFISIIVIFVLTKTTQGSLTYLGITLSVTPLIVMILFSIFLYGNKYNRISPSIYCIKFEYAGSLFSLGVKFFIIQISGLVLYHSSNIIISQLFGPSEVTPYNIAYKLFSLINMFFGIIMVPFWSAYTEAWKNLDIAWIKRSISKLIRIWIVMSLFGMVILIFSDEIYLFWVGDTVKIRFSLSALLYLYFIVFTFGGIFNMFINGVGKIKVQLYYSLITAALFYPLTYTLIRTFNMGSEGLALAILITNLPGPVISVIQFRKIVNGKATGIWNE